MLDLTPENIERMVEAQAHAFVAGMGVAVYPSDLRALLNEVAASRARIEALRLGLAKAEAAMESTLANAPEHATDCTVTVMGVEFGDGTCNCYVRDCEAALTEARALLSKPEAAPTTGGEGGGGG